MSLLKGFWKNQVKHIKLGDEWALAESEENDLDISDETENNIFKVKYLGKTAVVPPTNQQTTSKAVNTILAIAKVNQKKPTKINLMVTMKGIEAVDTTLNKPIFDISIFRISNCSTDSSHSRIFTFLASNNYDTTECYAFLCSKKGMVEQIAVSVAKCFNDVYETLQENKYNFSTIINDNKPKALQSNNIKRGLSVVTNTKDKVKKQSRVEDNVFPLLESNQNSKESSWVSFDNEQDDFFRRVSYQPVVICSKIHTINAHFFRDTEWNDRLIKF